MALWAKAQQLSGESLQQIRAVYGEHFPIEVRHYLASWIEDAFWTDIEPIPDNPQHEQYVATLFNNLIQELETKASAVNEAEFFLTKLKLAEAAKSFRQRFSNNPMQLFNYVRQCLATEMRLVQAASGEVPPGVQLPLGSSINADIIKNLEALRLRTRESAEDLRVMEQEQEAFALQYHDCTKKKAALGQLTAQPNNPTIIQKLTMEKEAMEALLNQKISRLLQLRLTLVDKLKESYNLLHQIQLQILDDELIRWKREQQLAGNGAIFNSSLDTIQEWCENLAEIIWANRQQVKEFDILKKKINLDHLNMTDMLGQLLNDFTQLISSLVTSTFVIEKQPPQVMKTNTRFTATVRLLVGGKLNVHMSPPQVRVSIISETQANVLLKSDRLTKSGGDGCGEILNNTGTMEYQQATKQLSASFRNMQLKKIKRAEKKGTESVMDEKFCLLFQSQFSVGGGELVFQVWTLSLPVVVIVHGNQEPHAWATVTWDNAFSDSGRVPFTVPDKVMWSRVADTLSLKFKAATGRALTDEHIQFLAEKGFRGNFTDSTQMLSWAQFCKEPLTERSFTFWEWFYAVMKLTREHLRGPWVDGAIIGFIRKKQAEEMLQSCPDGTFLLRFSDSELGGVTIAWVSDTSEVFMLQPFTSKDFGIRSLADRISDLNHLVNLYPNIPKDIAFTKYYTPYQENQGTTTNGYVKPLLVTHVPGWPGPGSFPNTPQHSFMQSPDPTRDTPSVTSSYADSVATTVAGSQSGMDYLDQFDDCNIDINGLVNFNEFIQGYKQ